MAWFPFEGLRNYSLGQKTECTNGLNFLGQNDSCKHFDEVVLARNHFR